MLFNSFTFLLFFTIIFFLYWVVFQQNLKLQNLLLLVSSYVFYGWWDWRFLFLIAFSSIVDFFVAHAIGKSHTQKSKLIFLIISLSTNLGLLGFFKYYNFFLESFADILNALGFQSNPNSLNIILPVGISFYTFQTLSYSIDVYRGKLKPSDDFIAFMSYVSFFPQLVAGPIERATNLLPQFYLRRSLKYSRTIDGLKQALWGFFKKMVIADNCAIFVNDIYGDYQGYDGWMLLFASVLFAFQIYGDFSGYSDIAIGSAKILGFDLMTNFRYPYFSRNIGEFWRRWHISLSTWFRDYLYIPLGGSRLGQILNIRNIFTIFIVSGLWHGANWTFVAWGGLNAVYFLPSFLVKENRKYLHSEARANDLPQIISTFILVVLAWVLFRSDSMLQAMNIYKKIFFDLIDLSAFRQSLSYVYYRAGYLIFLLVFLLVIEWLGRFDRYPIKELLNKRPFFRKVFYAIVITLIGIFYVSQGSPFIYFQF